MKKILTLLSFAAILLIGCNKKDSSSPSLPSAPNKQNHATVNFSEDNPDVTNPNGQQDKLNWATISSGSKGIAGFKLYDDPVEFNYDIEETRVSAGTRYHIDHFGVFEITSIGEDGSVTFKFYPEGSSGDPIVLSGTFDSEPYADNDLCRDWTVEKTTIKVVGKSISAGREFDGCNLKEISSWLRDKGLNIDEQPESRSITGLTLFENGGFAIFFKGEKPYYGDFTLGSDGSFSYNFTYMEDGDPIIAGSAAGSFVLAKEGKGKL